MIPSAVFVRCPGFRFYPPLLQLRSFESAAILAISVVAAQFKPERIPQLTGAKSPTADNKAELTRQLPGRQPKHGWAMQGAQEFGYVRSSSHPRSKDTRTRDASSAVASCSSSGIPPAAKRSSACCWDAGNRNCALVASPSAAHAATATTETPPLAGCAFPCGASCCPDSGK